MKKQYLEEYNISTTLKLIGKKAENFKPLKGEIIIYDMYDKNDNKVSNRVRHKIGNGIDYVNDLPFVDDKFIHILDNHNSTGTVLDGTDISTNSMDGLMKSGIVFIKLYSSADEYPDYEDFELLSLYYFDYGNAAYEFRSNSTSLVIRDDNIQISTIPQFNVDTNLTKSGYAADAKAVGDALKGYVKKGESENETATVIGSGNATGDNSTVIGNGTAIGEGSTVIGSGTASGVGATTIGSGTATGDYSVAEGADTLAGCMGFYIAAIDSANRHIYLHTDEDARIPTWDNPSSYYDETFETGYQILNDSDITSEDYNPYGNEFSIGSDSYYHWVFAGNVVEVSGNRITYSEDNSLDNTEKWLSNVNDGADPMVFFIPVQSDCGNTNVGLGSHAEGWETHAAAQHSHAEGYASIVAGRYGHAEGFGTRAGFAGHSEGQNTLASGLYSHAEGANTEALDSGAHAEGTNTKAFAISSHAEGQDTQAIGYASHAEGQETIAENSRTHAEGYQTLAKGVYSHTEGGNTTTYDKAGHAEGLRTTSLGLSSHSEGYSTKKAPDIISDLNADTYFSTIKSSWDTTKFSAAVGDASHIEGIDNLANTYAHAEGQQTIAEGKASHTEGVGTVSSSLAQHAQGKYNEADSIGVYAHIVGNGNDDANRSNAHTLDWSGNAWFAGGIKVGGTSQNDENAKQVLTEDFAEELSNNLVGEKIIDGGEVFNDYENNTASGLYSHAEGRKTTAVNEGSHIEGTSGIKATYETIDSATKDDVLADWNDRTEDMKYRYSQAFGIASHVEGTDCLALGSRAHAEGQMTIAYGNDSHAEGKCTKAEGSFSHAQGLRTKASGAQSHAEGSSTIASGESSHAEGVGTKASSKNQHVQGKYNIEDIENLYAHIVGNGTSDTKRSNAHTLDWSGNAWYAGNITTGTSTAPHRGTLIGTVEPDSSTGVDGDIYIMYA